MPATCVPEDNWSVRWTGRLTPPKTGLYALALRSDDGARLHLDGRLVVDLWGNHPPTLKTAEVELAAGRAHDPGRRNAAGTHEPSPTARLATTERLGAHEPASSRTLARPSASFDPSDCSSGGPRLHPAQQTG